MKSNGNLPGGYTTRDVFEIIDGTMDNAEVLRNRIHRIRDYTSLGPPDVCYLSKQYSGGSLLSSNKESIKLGLYHYVHGLNLSTPASVSAYINHMIKSMEEEKQSLLKRGEWKVVKGYFCIFDAFSRIDIHLQITIPGTMKLYGFTAENELVTVNDQLWERALVSSAIRSMHQQEVPAGKYLSEFPTLDSMKEFMKGLRSVVRVCDLAYESVEESGCVLKYAGSKAVYLVTEYLIRKRMLSVAVELFSESIEENPKFVLPLNRIYVAMSRVPDAMRLLAGYLVKQPDSASLLYYQAKNLYELGRYEQAYRLVHFLSGGLQSKNFDVWYLLAEIFLKLENYEYALVSLNVAAGCVKRSLFVGSFPDVSLENSKVCEKAKLTSKITSPKEWQSISSFANIFVINPAEPAILRAKKNAAEKSKSGVSDKSAGGGESQTKQEQAGIDQTSKVSIEELNRLGSFHLSEDELRLFMALADLEKRLGWDNLIKLRSNIFLLNLENVNESYDSGADFPFQIAASAVAAGKGNAGGINGGSQTAIPSHHSREEIESSHRIMSGNVGQGNAATSSAHNLNSNVGVGEANGSTAGVNEFPLELDGQDCFEEAEDELPSFLKDDVDDGKSKNYGMANIKDPQIQKNIQRKLHMIKQKQQSLTVNANPKFDKNNNHHITELTEDSLESERIVHINGVSKLYASHDASTKGVGAGQSLNDVLGYPEKRVIHSALNHLFTCLFEDMTYVMRWQEEEKEKEEASSKQQSKKQPVEWSSEVWLLRAQFALRLGLSPLAFTALKEVLKKNFCFFAYGKLLGLAEANEDPKQMVFLLAELLDEIEAYGVKMISSLPSWIEDHFLAYISKQGIQNFKAKLLELKFEDQVISSLIKKAEYWKTDGSQVSNEQTVNPNPKGISSTPSIQLLKMPQKNV